MHQLWQKVDLLITLKQAKAYDEAVEIIAALKEAAEYKGTQTAFQERINKIHESHKRLSGLRERMKSCGLKASD
jgi:uncharacterized Zn finger protein